MNVAFRCLVHISGSRTSERRTSCMKYGSLSQGQRGVEGRGTGYASVQNIAAIFKRDKGNVKPRGALPELWRVGEALSGQRGSVCLEVPGRIRVIISFMCRRSENIRSSSAGVRFVQSLTRSVQLPLYHPVLGINAHGKISRTPCTSDSRGGVDVEWSGKWICQPPSASVVGRVYGDTNVPCPQVLSQGKFPPTIISPQLHNWSRCKFSLDIVLAPGPDVASRLAAADPDRYLRVIC
ncbi:hypothetical protein O3P69_007373 [Scylla paramamosain]|uniref:Uncharacterized protein n=1 Tax=Scylla paramamosain TaxID=85552 RepID=A0AAW0V485_SCYPA